MIVYEPTDQYQNVSKRAGVEKLTPARALVAEMIHRYWILGIECSLLEIQKLAYFLKRSIEKLELENPLDLRFQADKDGPYAPRLTRTPNETRLQPIWGRVMQWRSCLHSKRLRS